MSVNEQIKKLRDDAFIPVRSTDYSACKDLFSPEDFIIEAKSNKLIRTGIAIAWDNPDYYMQIWSRSGLAYKLNLVVQAGVIDYDYRREIGVLLQNNSDNRILVAKGERIAQYNYLKIVRPVTEEVTEFTFPLESNRVGGFGSTGF